MTTCHAQMGVASGFVWGFRRKAVGWRLWGNVAAALFIVGSTAAWAGVPALWLSPSSGSWTSATSWSTAPLYPNNGSPAGTVYDASIAAAGSAYTVTLNSNVSVNSLLLDSAAATLLQSGGVFQVSGTATVTAGTYRVTGGTAQAGELTVADGSSFTLAGGTLNQTRLTSQTATGVHLATGILSAVTCAGRTVIDSNAKLSVAGGLALDSASLSLTGYAAALTFSGTQELSGTGEILFTGSEANATVAPSAGSTLTIGPGITLRACATGFGGGVIGSASGDLVNNGTIFCDAQWANLTVTGRAWDNNGTLRVSQGTLSLGGSTTTEGLGHIEHLGGTLRFTGTIDNRAAVLDLDPLGTVNISRGTIIGGTIRSTGIKLVSNGSSFTLDGVTLQADVDHRWIYGAEGSIAFRNGLTLSGGHIYLNTGGGLIGQGALTGNGLITIEDLPNGSNWESRIEADSIGSGIVVSVGGGGLNNRAKVVTLLNQGVISTAGLSTTVGHWHTEYVDDCPVVVADSWTNAGVIRVDAGTMTVSANCVNTGSILANSGTLVLEGAWNNQNAITGNNATVRFAGNGTGFDRVTLTNCNADVASLYTTAQIRQVAGSRISWGVFSNGTLNGVLDNTSDVLLLSGANSDFRLAGGTLRGGIVRSNDGHKIIGTTGNSKLEGVELEVPVVSSGGQIVADSIVNGSGITLSSGWLTLSGSWLNPSSITIGRATLAFKSMSTQIGTISVNNGTCSFYADVTTEQLQSINMSSTSCQLNRTMTLDNRGQTLMLSAAVRSLWFYGGTIRGGTILTTDSSQMEIANSAMGYDGPIVLDGVTLATKIRVTGSKTPTSINGLTLQDAVITMGETPYGSGYWLFDGTQGLNGRGTFYLRGDRGAAALRCTSGELTIGKDIVIYSDTNRAEVGQASGGTIRNQGTISSRGSGLATSIMGGFTNEGVVEARGGGVVLLTAPALLTNLSAGTLHGGTWMVLSGSAIRFNGASISVLDASLILDGLNSNVYNSSTAATNALSGLNRIGAAGSLELLNGRSMTVDGDLELSGKLSLVSGSTFCVGGDFTQSTGATLLLSIGDSGAPLNVAAKASVAGQLTIVAGSSFTPALGQNYDLLDFGQIQGRFENVTLPQLPDGLAWSTSSLYTTGMIAVVPEPTTLCLMLGLTMLSTRRQWAGRAGYSRRSGEAAV